MKRVLALFVSLLVSIPLAIGVMAGISYYTTSDSSVPKPAIKVMEEEILPSGYDWHEPVFGGILYRDFRTEPDAAEKAANVGLLEDAQLNLEVPGGYDASVAVMQANETVWTGTPEEINSYRFINNGGYQMRVNISRGTDETTGYGSLTYLCAFTVRVEPRYEVSDEWVQQGDMMAIRFFNLDDDDEVSAACDLGPVQFVDNGEGRKTGYLAIGHDRDTGAYAMTLTAGRHTWEVIVRVIETSFPVQTVQVEVTDPLEEIRPRAAGPVLDTEYIDTVTPLFEEGANTQYWDGLFIEPVQGEVGRSYGTFLYTNALEQYTRQPGMAIKADLGTDVLAPAAGKVVFAGELKSTGNTVVIEHGGGLKSLLFYMDEIEVREGQMVDKRDKIGTVGMTGYATEPQLHYEVRLGRFTVNPTLLFSGASKLYYFQ